jgi:hypothetical protein
MARLGMTSSRKLAATVRHPDRTVNKAGGEAFEVRDPSLRLLTMVGGSFWNEPTYYGDTPGAERREGLSDEATLVVDTALEIARGPNPRDLLALALWARSEMNIRTTPQVLLAVAANEPATKPFVRAYTPKVVQRADELRQVFAAHLSLFAGGVGANVHGQKLPNSLKKGLADAFGRFSEAQLMKYDSDVRPTFRDVLRMIDRSRDRGLPQALFRYLTTGEVTDPAATPVAAARKRLAQKTALDDEARALIRETRCTWEVVLSQFGNARATWEAVLPEMGYMAVLRNLRNLAASGVDLAPALAKIADPKEVARSRQLPFRFWSAYLTLEAAGALSSKAADALEDALTHSAAVLPRLPGVTVVASDNSGSMGSPVSAKSVVTRQAAANLLAAIAQRISDDGRAIVFGETAALVPISTRDGLITNLRKQSATDVGHSTNAHRAVELMLKQKIKADRLIVFSDMQCWNSAGGADTLAGAVAKYRRAVNPALYVHSVDLAGSGKSAVVPDDPRTNLVSGFSEKVLATVLAFESATVEAAPTRATARALPTLDDIRARY